MEESVRNSGKAGWKGRTVSDKRTVCGVSFKVNRRVRKFIKYSRMFHRYLVPVLTRVQGEEFRRESRGRHGGRRSGGTTGTLIREVDKNL